METKKNKGKKQKPANSYKSYVRYSALGFQMMVLILIGVFGGLQLDKWLTMTPLFTVAFSLLAVLMAIGLLFKDLLQK